MAQPATRVHEAHGRPVRVTVRRYCLHVAVPGTAPRVEHIGAAAIRIGSQRGNDVILDDDAVSRVHLEIIADHHGFRLRDLDSTGGTLVDGTRVIDVYLRPGAVIRVGASELRFEPGDDEAELVLSEDDRFGTMIGHSVAMRALFASLSRAARSNATVLVEGESGTGKELVAEALHRASPRAAKRFVVFDCAAVTPSLLESELFGHERGAFTGAYGTRPGCLETADGGTLFLDEVGELPLDLQPKLLRCLERGEFRRVGSNEPRRVDIRVIAATNRDLAGEVNRGSFREDLYYRLAVVRLVTPALRERTGDIPQLVESFLLELYEGDAVRAHTAVAHLDARVWKQLRSWPWPGNVRELRNAVARSVALAGDDLPTEISLISARRGHEVPAPPSTGPPDGEPERPFLELRSELVHSFERDYLQRMLSRYHGKITRAADAAGLDRSYFRRLLRRHGIES
jgi:transcriptional regulator with GAF, ATPase, and Fis domain